MSKKPIPPNVVVSHINLLPHRKYYAPSRTQSGCYLSSHIAFLPHSHKKNSPQNMTYSPKRAMAELRHTISFGPRATSSPMKRDEDSSPLVSDAQPQDDDDGRGRHPYKDRDRPLLSHFQSLCPFLGDDTKSSRISLFVVIIVALVGLVSIFAIVKRVVSILFMLFLSGKFGVWQLG